MAGHAATWQEVGLHDPPWREVFHALAWLGVCMIESTWQMAWHGMGMAAW